VKQLVCAAMVLLAIGAGRAIAACTPPFMTAVQIQTLLAGNTACIGHTPNAEWSEWHNGGASGNVVDWKLGASNPVDPTKTVGTFLITTSITAGTVKYTYDSQSYTYFVQQGASNPYTFCNTGGSPSFAVMVNPGQGPC
jgi:hypothetical protein